MFPDIWLFKVKRGSDGTFKNSKAKYCIRGKLQEVYIETYVLVVHFTYVRLFLAWSLMFGWYTCSIDFINTFTQATLKEPIFIHLPCRLRGHGNQKMLLKLKKSLYGLDVAPRLQHQNFWVALKKGIWIWSMSIDEKRVIWYIDTLGIQDPKKEIVDKLIAALKRFWFCLLRFILRASINPIHNDWKGWDQDDTRRTTETNDYNSNRTLSTKKSLGWMKRKI